MNKVILMGNLTRDPEVRYSQSGEPIAITKFGIAVNKRFKREGEPDVDFFDCVSFGKQAEFVEKYFKKGMKALVSGRLSTNSWDDKTTGQRRWKTEILVDDVEFTESRSAYEQRMANAPREPRQDAAASAPASTYEPEGFSAIAESIDDDDLPF